MRRSFRSAASRPRRHRPAPCGLIASLFRRPWRASTFPALDATELSKQPHQAHSTSTLNGGRPNRRSRSAGQRPQGVQRPTRQGRSPQLTIRMQRLAQSLVFDTVTAHWITPLKLSSFFAVSSPCAGSPGGGQKCSAANPQANPIGPSAARCRAGERDTDPGMRTADTSTAASTRQAKLIAKPALPLCRPAPTRSPAADLVRPVRYQLFDSWNETRSFTSGKKDGGGAVGSHRGLFGSKSWRAQFGLRCRSRRDPHEDYLEAEQGTARNTPQHDRVQGQDKMALRDRRSQRRPGRISQCGPAKEHIWCQR